MVGSPGLARESLFGTDMPEETANRYFKKLQDESFRAFLDEALPNFIRPKRVKTPLLVIGGSNDTVISRKAVNDTARAYSTQAEFFPLAHDVMLENGWRLVADRIIQWLKEKQL